jgi:hypothetical protein
MLLSMEQSKNNVLLDHANMELKSIIENEFQYLTIDNFIENNEKWYQFVNGLKNVDLEECNLEDLINDYFYDYMLRDNREALETYLYEEITNYLEENEQEFICIIEELGSWNGYLDGDRWEDMDFLDDYLCNEKPLDLLILGKNFNPYDDYFRFDVYGNLESTNYKEYNDYISDYFIDDIIENYQRLDIPGDLDPLLMDLEKIQEVE